MPPEARDPVSAARSTPRGRLVVAAGGGVAALKTPSLLRRLREAGFEVRAAATDDAYHFVPRMALAAAAGGEVLDRDLWFRPDGEARHLSWASWADGLVVAPATADLLASIALGRADDVVSALALGGPPVLFAPAMNSAMWKHAAVQRNVERLRADGHAFVGPATGSLGTVHEAPGVGRMSEPEAIVDAVARWMGPGDMAGLRVLVSAGPTREYADPVRFLSNPSSGKMGYAVAAAALARGADVDLVSGPSTETPPEGADLVRVTTAEEMLAALEAAYDRCDVLVMTAAVADWRPAEVATEKQPKGGDARSLELVRTPDILARTRRTSSRLRTTGMARRCLARTRSSSQGSSASRT